MSFSVRLSLSLCLVVSLYRPVILPLYRLHPYALSVLNFRCGLQRIRPCVPSIRATGVPERICYCSSEYGHGACEHRRWGAHVSHLCQGKVRLAVILDTKAVVLLLTSL